LPVFSGAISGLIQPFVQALSTMAHSIVLMVTGMSSMLSVQEASQGAGQMRPVNSGNSCSAPLDCGLPLPTAE
jgi:hypothetical protein